MRYSSSSVVFPPKAGLFLLSLQSDQISGDNFNEAFKDSMHRIRSMSIIHEKLYQSENLSQIDFADYMNDLISYIIGAYASGEMRLSFEFNFDKVFLSIDAAVHAR